MLLNDETGARYGRLLVLGRDYSRNLNSAYWRCQCDCGALESYGGTKLRSGAHICCNACIPRKSKRRGGKSYLAEYRTWGSIRARCENSKTKKFANHGGRGIKVCDRWMSFDNFFADMGPKPTPKHTIDRINNDGNYEPGNCRWATLFEQANNTRRNIFILYRGQSMTVSQAVRAAGSVIDHRLAYHRLRRGWTPEDAVETIAHVPHY
jgi:hypothetical protein